MREGFNLYHHEDIARAIHAARLGALAGDGVTILAEPAEKGS